MWDLEGRDGSRAEDYEYPLPAERIAQEGLEPRDASRLLVVRRGSFEQAHHRFHELPALLEKGDLLVFNETRVMPARLFGYKLSGGRVEVLLVRLLATGVWEAMLRPARRAPGGTLLRFDEELSCTVAGEAEAGLRLLRFAGDVWSGMARLGRVPLPPYVHAQVDPDRYQTVYAQVTGSVAAPTAGLHFTSALLKRLEASGIEIAKLVLHVGPGTFRPVKDSIEAHRMHQEIYWIPEETAARIDRARLENRRVVAVGTTVVRAMESALRPDGGVRAGSGATRLFVSPPRRVLSVDALITNFHLPRSTLLMLVAAFTGYASAMRAYQAAVESDYRFYSLGDVMLIL